MQPRNYTKLIQIFENTSVPDGYGGNTVTSLLKFTVWANVVTKSAKIATDNGDINNVETIIFSIRNRFDLDLNAKVNYISYNGVLYNIIGFSNLDLDNIEVQIYASKRDN